MVRMPVMMIPDRDALLGRGLVQAPAHGGHRLVRRQALLGVHQGAEPDLQVPDALGGEILGQFAGHPRQVLRRLQHGQRCGRSSLRNSC